MSSYKVIGLMSGSSLDGLDIAYCEFKEDGGKWSYEVLKSACIPYPVVWQLRLSKLVLQNAINYLKTHFFFGHYLGNLVNDFIEEHGIRDEADFIASHGQTIFHQPENKLTSQIGDGSAIAAETGLPVVCDFRTMDVALGGQGTPIVPIGEKYLYPGYKFYLNLGGIVNISCHVSEDVQVAFDICAANLALNALARDLNAPYDAGGEFAASGQMNEDLLDNLNQSWYFEKDYPKSLSGGWVSRVFMPVIRRSNINTEDKLNTVCEHIALQIAKDINYIQTKENISFKGDEQMLVTGGGALNKFLVERIQSHSPIELVVPEEQTIQFKEAIIIGLAGALRVNKQPNMLSSVTGSSQDNIGGCIYQGTYKTL